MQTERAGCISQIKSLKGDNRQFQSIVDEKIKEIEPLQQALGKLRKDQICNIAIALHVSKNGAYCVMSCQSIL